MCKHILIREFQVEDLSVLRTFAARTYDRDGFGAIIRRTDNSIETLKSLSAPALYLELGAALSRGDATEVVVHHRTSTNGAGIEYAHPFEFQGNYMTHNGVVQVPGKHETMTTNDSETLLHHFIKTGYNTKTVKGYFSVFVLNSDGTTIVVDDRAPIYTNGRIFCSLDLGEMERIVNKRITFTRDGTRTESKIELQESDYGNDKAHLSIGTGAKVVQIGGKKAAASFRWPIQSDDAIAADFLDSLSMNAFLEIEGQPSRRASREMILRIAHHTGSRLSKQQVELILNEILPDNNLSFDWRGY